MSEQIFEIRIDLKWSKPPIWRRMAVPGSLTLGQLHEIIQIVMSWEDCHLHLFIQKLMSKREARARMVQALDEGRISDFNALIDTNRFLGNPEFDPEVDDEKGLTLAEACPEVKSKLEYEYDLGDSWMHLIEVKKIYNPKEGVKYPICLAGRNTCPPDDCGGLGGYYLLLDALKDPEHDWYEEAIETLGEDFVETAFDLAEINALLSAWKPRRHSQPRSRNYEWGPA